MSKLTAVVYLSLDGVFEDPSWSGPFWNDEHAKFQNGQLTASRALVLGRKTYQEMSQVWPKMDHEDDFAARMNSIPKYVASTTLQDVGWNSVLLGPEVAKEIAARKAEPGQDLLLYGSGELLTHLIEHDLVDELKLFLHPVIVGSGKRLFPAGISSKTWSLAATSAFSSGAIVLDYRPA